jgi:hypothetical protein
MRDERQWVLVEVIWDREPRATPPTARGFPWPQAVAPTERPRPTRFSAPPPPRRNEARDDEPTPRRRKGEGKRRDRKRQPRDFDEDY